MASPFCAICERSRDFEGVIGCEAFPHGIPEAFYPWGCEPLCAYDKGFISKQGTEKIAMCWQEFFTNTDNESTSLTRRLRRTLSS
jgi:hypothetical protein